MNAHTIDYQIFGEEMQYVELELDPNEAVIAEAGNFMMMDSGIKMNTIFGDGSKQNEGFLGKVLGAGKRLLTGESLFITIFSNEKSCLWISVNMEVSSSVKKMLFYVLQKEFQ
jgi:uncharacterized protein (AIM24 family)